MVDKQNKHRSFLFIKNTWSLIIIVALIVMFITHLVAFFTLSRYNEKAQLQINRGIAARQIITLIEAVEINPSDKREYIVNAIDIPNVSISLNHYPKYQTQVSSLKILDILLKIHEIPPSSNVIQLSVKFDQNLWLNVSSVILESSWTPQFVLFGLELLIVILLFFMLWSFNRYNKPLKEFIQSVERMGRSLNSEPLNENRGPAMVRQAAKAINQMRARLSHLVQDRTQMLAAISHDLRTPITRLKLRAQLLEDEALQEKISKDLEDMERMINESLSFFRDEQLAVDKKRMDLAALLDSLCADYQELGKSVSYQGAKRDCLIEGNSLAMKRAFSNLIDNALKYGEIAKVKLSAEENTYVITIEDQGPGIKEDDYEHVFKPFYRGEQSRSRATGGTGLGLAVTHSIILAHQGEIQFNPIPQGFQVKVLLHRLESL